MELNPKEFSAVIKVRAGKTYPDLVNSLALRNLPKDTAAAEGWPTYYMPSACANGHTAARFVKNDLCIDCWRVRQRREVLYPTAKNRTYYKQRDTAAAVTATGAPVVIAPPTPPEPKPAEQRFLAELAELRDIDKACAAVPGWSRGLVESRCSSNPIFRAAFQDMCDRLGIATRAPDAAGSQWTMELEKRCAMLLVDCGLVEQTRTELGITASEWHSRLEKSSTFAAMIEAAKPLARLTLRDRATKEAAAGNDRLLKILEVDAPESTASMSVEQLNNEIRRLLERFDAQGLIHHQYVYRHTKTGAQIDLREYEPVESNSDLVGG